MSINKHNYEVFFVDYLDGSLSKEQNEDLQNFLLQNTNLAAELESLQDFKLTEDKIIFQSKSILKKQFIIDNDK